MAQEQPQSWRLERTLALAFAGFVVLVALLAFLSYRQQVADFRQTKLDELDAMATFKMEQIYHWRQEHVLHAATLVDLPMLGREIQWFLANPNALQTSNEIRGWIRHLQTRLRYEQVLLLDARRQVRIASPADARVDPGVMVEAEKVFRTGEPMLSDCHQGLHSNHLHLEVLIPFQAEAASEAPMPRAPAPRPPLALLLCTLDAEAVLNPLLAARAASVSGHAVEFELARREGEEAVLLNEPAAQAGHGFRTRFSLRRRNSLVVQAVLGQSGLARETRDHRGRAVLAAHRRVPDSPWCLVVKTDQAEVYAPLRSRGWTTAGAVLGMLLLAGMLLRAFWQRQKLEYARKELAVERRRQALANRVTLLLKQANDIILLTDERWQIVDANERALQTYGYSLEELKGLSLRDLRAPEARGQFETELRDPATLKGVIFETRHRCKNGRTLPVESSLRAVEIEGRWFQQLIVRDITERKERERETQRLTRLYAVLGEVSQTIVRAATPEEILQKVCDLAVRTGGFKLVWVGWQGSPGARLLARAQAGAADGYVAQLRALAEQGGARRTLAETAVAEGHPCLSNDLLADPQAQPFRELLERHGLGSAGAFPLRSPQGQVAGALTLYAGELGAFGKDETALLGEVAEDISFALRHLEEEVRRRQAETALRRERDFISLTLETVGALVVTLDREGRIVSFNRACQETTGYSLEEARDRRFWELLLLPEEIAPVQAMFWELRSGLFPNQHQNYWKTKSGGRRLILWSNTVVTDERGVVEYVIGTGIDITEHHDAEAARRASEARLSGIIEHTPHVAVQALDDAGRILMWNPAAQALYGWHEAEVLGQTVAELMFTPEEAARFQTELQELSLGRRDQCRGEYTIRTKEGAARVVDSTLFPLPGLDGPRQFICMDVDITERKRAEESVRLNEQRAEALLKLHQMAEQPLQAITGFVLEEGVRLTRSKMGYLAFLNDDETILTMHAWSAGAMAECAIQDKPRNYRVADTGLWGEAVRQRRPVITNDYAAPNPLKKGTPAGHVAVLRHANVPVFDGAKIVAVAGVGDKPEPYDDSDTRQLTILMQGMWRLIQRQRAAQQLQAYRDRLDAVIKSIPLPMFAKDRDGRYLLVNAAFTRFFGTASEQVVGRTVFECYPSEDAEVFHQRDLEQMESDHIQSYEHRLRDGAGHWREVLLTKACFHTSQGAVAGLVGTLTDLTERKRSEESLRALVAGTAAVAGTDFFRSLVRRLAEALTVKYAFVAEVATPEAPQAHVHCLWSAGQLVGPLDYELAETPCAVVLAEGTYCCAEAVQARFPKSPILRDLGAESYLGIVLRDAQNVPLGLLVVMHDQPLAPDESLRSILTIFAARAGVELERIRAERKILELNRSLEQRVAERTAQLTASNDELEAFSYSVSHDLRAPLRHVSGFVELLRDRVGAQLDERARHFMEVIVHSTQEMGQLIDDLLAFSRMGRMELQRVPLDLAALAGEAMASLAEETAGRPITWSIAPLPTVVGDPTLLRLALVNLLSNAVKYTRGRQPALITLGCQADQPREWVFFVRDNGAGFDMRFVSKLFGVFQRLHRTEEYEGTGIGLANVRRIIQRHEGRVWAEGAVNQGATFYFTLPRS